MAAQTAKDVKGRRPLVVIQNEALPNWLSIHPLDSDQQFTSGNFQQDRLQNSIRFAAIRRLRLTLICRGSLPHPSTSRFHLVILHTR